MSLQTTPSLGPFTQNTERFGSIRIGWSGTTSLLSPTAELTSTSAPPLPPRPKPGATPPARSRTAARHTPHSPAVLATRRVPGKIHTALAAAPRDSQRLPPQVPLRPSFRPVAHPLPDASRAVAPIAPGGSSQSSQSGQTPAHRQKSADSRSPRHTPVR